MQLHKQLGVWSKQAHVSTDARHVPRLTKIDWNSNHAKHAQELEREIAQLRQQLESGRARTKATLEEATRLLDLFGPAAAAGGGGDGDEIGRAVASEARMVAELGRHILFATQNVTAVADG